MPRCWEDFHSWGDNTSEVPRCCEDFHSWGDNGEYKGCGPELSDPCNSWCQSQCRGGECKLHGDLHYCHCFC
ncbi:hypothetical protein GUJ93_ZPchr0006g44738 [Zizania palustris]|uniref:Uncharacterized protein n=1 Tax=Zizania palustris TaxID=103762 RepID=A0A8J5SUN7_ZIZPA|nr:hypothetical protein GUJ93_ZPchr0006g44738 [Zizania palustris]